MRVEIDERSGFCFGVVRAITLAEEALREHDTVYSLGDIVHNRVEVQRLEALGLKTIENFQLSTFNFQLFIRAHGEPPSTYEKAKKMGIEVIDATCPVVAQLQRKVVEAHREMEPIGGQVVLLGKRGHAEVVGLTGQVERETIVIEDEKDLDLIDFTRPIYFLSQTTQSIGLFEKLEKLINEKISFGISHPLPLTPSLRRGKVLFSFSNFSKKNLKTIFTGSKRCLRRFLFFRAKRVAAPRGGVEGPQDKRFFTALDTICRQVSGREKELKTFARTHDVIVFVSGRKSSNGRVLFDVCRAANPRSYLIEDPSELRPEWFGGDNVTVGICGATSTPKWLMEQVKSAIEKQKYA